MGAAKAAEFLDLSPSTLRDYSDRGIIPCYRIGKHRKYSLEKIREKLEKEQREIRPYHRRLGTPVFHDLPFSPGDIRMSAFSDEGFALE